MRARLPAALAGAVLFAAAILPVAAATPTGQASFAVSATVVPRCDSTACQSVRPVARYSPPGGGEGQPGFELSRDAGQPVLTITY